VLPPVSYELADFSPGSSHLHGCAADLASCRPCDSGCLHALFDVAQELDRALARAHTRPAAMQAFGPTGDPLDLPWSKPVGRGLVVEVRESDPGAAEVWASNQRVLAHEASAGCFGHDDEGDCCRRAKLGLPQRSELCVCQEPRPAVGEGQLVPVGAYIRCLGCRRLIEP
jgi:hypothetical protein